MRLQRPYGPRSRQTWSLSQYFGVGVFVSLPLRVRVCVRVSVTDPVGTRERVRDLVARVGVCVGVRERDSEAEAESVTDLENESDTERERVTLTLSDPDVRRVSVGVLDRVRVADGVRLLRVRDSVKLSDSVTVCECVGRRVRDAPADLPVRVREWDAEVRRERENE